MQGGTFEACRRNSADALTQHDFSGFSIGGLSVGEPLDQLHDMAAFTADLLPKDKPRYLMGVGLPENFEPAILAGIDMFDCVAPTRLARHGNFFTSEGKRTFEMLNFRMTPSRWIAPVSVRFASSILVRIFGICMWQTKR